MTRRLDLTGLIAAETVSSTGSQMTVVALPWFVLVTTGSVTQMALVVAVELVAILILAIPSGFIVARVGSRQTMLFSDLSRGVLLASIPALHLAGLLTLPLLLLIVFLTGSLWAPYDASQVVLMAEATANEDVALARANSLFQGANRLTYTLGPALAGLLIATVGSDAVLLIDAGTYLVSFALVSTLVHASPHDGGRDQRPKFSAGVRVLLKDPFIRRLTAAQALSQMAFQTLMIALPVLAFQRYDGSSVAAGALVASWGAGALVGSALAYRMVRTVDQVKLVRVAWFGQAAPLWLLALSPSAFVAGALLFSSGIANGLRVPAMMTMFTLRIPPPERPQVMTASTTVITAGSVLAAVGAGPALEGLGLTAVLLIVAGTITLATILFSIGGISLGASAELHGRS